MRIATLKKRAEFERVRGGGRWSTALFVLEGKGRPAQASIEPGPRFGFTISKKVGNAVERNRIRRRLRGALAEVSGPCADPGFDYVVVARTPALDCPFTQLKSDLETAFRRVHEGPRRKQADKSRNMPPGSHKSQQH